MTMSNDVLDWLASRGIDVELAARLGIASVRRDGGESVVIPFVRDGQTVRRKYRQLQGDAKWFQDKGAQRIAYNEDCLRRDDLTGQAVVITEGEFDAIAAIQAGFERTISVPDGAPPPGERDKADLEGGRKYAWLEDIRPYLTMQRAPEIIIAADGDDNGAALMQDLSVLLGRARCKFLTYPKSKKDRGRERCKDLNEVLEDYGQRGVVETIARAQFIPLKGVYRMSELPPPPPMTIYEPRHRLFAENFKVRLGDFSVFTGTPGFGKTSFANDVFCGIAADRNIKIAWASFEQEPQRDHRRALRSWYLEMAEWRADETQRRAADAWIDAHHLFLIPQEDEDPTFEWLLDAMELAVIRHDARVIIIDPWNEIEHDRHRDETETEYIGRAIRSLKRFARRFKVHVCVIAHPTKSTKDGEGNYRMPTLYDIAGSANWYNKCDLGVIVHREDEDHTIIKVQKSRYHEVLGVPGEVRMQYCKDARYFTEIVRVA